MDSQLTLVDSSAPLPERSAQTVFTFSRDSLLNATLRILGTDSTVYVIKTNTTTTRTVVSRMIPGSAKGVVEVVKIERNDILPNKITFEGFPSMKLNNWLKKQTFSDPARPNVTTQYVWKPTSAREVALYITDMPLRPIAWFRSSIPSVEPATLSLQPEAEPIQDAVVASLILVEQQYRADSKHYSARGNLSYIICAPVTGRHVYFDIVLLLTEPPRAGPQLVLTPVSASPPETRKAYVP
ncbi:hypothetical protein EIP91_004466 [Steccherinum ochraceum]|uniref:DUF6593 domain-containing protein n=1 Tax=Steccherinum ochraceum TaxID=92696 RepID=A0A4R0R8T7_9APHY|nr:hypothetical protein EIP91_004466 [Steccherinum ochraceum]